MPEGAWLVEYGHVARHPAAGFLFGAVGAGGTPFCFAVISSRGTVTLIDAGFSAPFHQRRLSGKHGGGRWITPVGAVGRLGIPAGTVETIVLTHKHFDHAGAVGDFPRAEVVAQRTEIERHRQAVTDPARFAAELRATDPDLLETLARGRVRLVDGPGTAGPVRLRPALDTHTPGSQYAELDTADGPLVFAGDNVSVYQNVEGDGPRQPPLPIGSLTGPVENWLALAREITAVVGGDTRRIIPFHDDAVWSRYPTVTFSDTLRVAALTSATPLPANGGRTK
jgi:glyoxylase-like metal-dependent hydrolase (beta-lactamase superfamily II)